MIITDSYIMAFMNWWLPVNGEILWLSLIKLVLIMFFTLKTFITHPSDQTQLLSSK